MDTDFDETAAPCEWTTVFWLFLLRKANPRVTNIVRATHMSMMATPKILWKMAVSNWKTSLCL